MRATIHISGPSENIFSADQIVGKSLFAKKKVVLKRLPSDDAATIYTVPSGTAVGVVYSWVGGGSSPLWWQFLDENKKAYYAKHETGTFSIEALKEQGALDVKEQAEEEKKKKEAENGGGSLFDIPNPFGDINLKPLQMVGYGVAALAAVILLSNLTRK